MRLQVPVRFVVGLPDAAEVRLAVGRARHGSGLRWPAADARHHGRGDEGADCRRYESHSNGRTSQLTCHEALPTWSNDSLLRQSQQIPGNPPRFIGSAARAKAGAADRCREPLDAALAAAHIIEHRRRGETCARNVGILSATRTPGPYQLERIGRAPLWRGTRPRESSDGRRLCRPWRPCVSLRPLRLHPGRYVTAPPARSRVQARCRRTAVDSERRFERNDKDGLDPIGILAAAGRAAGPPRNVAPPPR